jgi:glucose/arabinose dehydrogenase
MDGVMMKRSAPLALLPAILLAAQARAQAPQSQAPQFTPDGVPRQPFAATLSNNKPLAFGMNVEETSQALRQPLQYVSGPPGNEIYLALRNLGGSGLINHHDRLFLQFRHGKLAGWKEDYGRNWMWQ